MKNPNETNASSISKFTESELAQIRRKADYAKEALIGNIRKFEQFEAPVLIAGDVYFGIWLEHNQDNLFLAEYAPDAAWESQEIFMDHQREDGLMPFMFPLQRGGEKGDAMRYWHLQTVYPFARCALDLAVRMDKAEDVFARIYKTAARYDEWITKNRNQADTGSVEMYCEWDTGHDNSPCVTDGGIPHTCPENEAANMPPLQVMPILSVDLSATLYGGRVALAELASRLGKSGEASLWREKGDELRAKIKELLYDQQDGFYYDRNTFGFRKYRSEHITRLFLNGIPDQQEFDDIYSRYFACGKEFWTPFPFPSLSPDDPSFVRDCPKNSGGANSQALTTLRAILWMDRYGRSSELNELLYRWLYCSASPGIEKWRPPISWCKVRQRNERRRGCGEADKASFHGGGEVTVADQASSRRGSGNGLAWPVCRKSSTVT